VADALDRLAAQQRDAAFQDDPGAGMMVDVLRAPFLLDQLLAGRPLDGQRWPDADLLHLAAKQQRLLGVVIDDREFYARGARVDDADLTCHGHSFRFGLRLWQAPIGSQPPRSPFALQPAIGRRRRKPAGPFPRRLGWAGRTGPLTPGEL